MTVPTTREEAAALAVLAKRGRILAIVIPKGIDREQVLTLQREVNAKLEILVAERGRLT